MSRKSKIIVIATAVIVMTFFGLAFSGVLSDTSGEEIEATINYTAWRELRDRPISTLNLTELQLVVDYYAFHGMHDWAQVYQNQILINELRIVGDERQYRL